jgi:crossover junction endodeoxyribonuclease RusA
MTELVFAWPPSVLNPNQRAHWSMKSRAAKAYRHDCWARTKAANITLPDNEKLALWIDFYPPDKRHRDDDNMIAAFKSGRDGLAEALGVNDKRFRIFPQVMDKIGGMVKVRITDVPIEQH